MLWKHVVFCCFIHVVFSREFKQYPSPNTRWDFHKKRVSLNVFCVKPIVVKCFFFRRDPASSWFYDVFLLGFQQKPFWKFKIQPWVLRIIQSSNQFVFCIKPKIGKCSVFPTCILNGFYYKIHRKTNMFFRGFFPVLLTGTKTDTCEWKTCGGCWARIL